MRNSFTKHPIIFITAILSLSLLVISCSEEEEDIGIVDIPINPTSVSITAPPNTLSIGDTLQLQLSDTLRLSAIVEPQDSVDQQVLWSSSNATVATIDTTGLVTSIAEGTTTIVATSQEDLELKDTLQLRVAKPNTILVFSIQGLETVQPIITDTTVIFKIDFNTKGKALDVAKLTATVIHNGTSVSTPEGIPVQTTDFTATIVQDFRRQAKAYTVTREDGEARTYQVSIQTKPGTEFITTWNTANITILTNPNLEGYNYNIDTNNDGFIDHTRVTGDALVNFTSGARTLRISGQFPAIFFGSFGSENNKIQSLDQWGTVAWKSMEDAFVDCDSLQIPATDVPDLSKVKDMSFMFSLADKVNPDVSNWKTSNVTDMSGLFKATEEANPDVTNWDTSNVTNMTVMFEFATKANPDVSRWKTDKVNSMRRMFAGATNADPDVSNWNTANVNIMESMFAGATRANPDVSNWNTRNVRNMDFMFSRATNANPDVSNWDTSNTTRMQFMFLNAPSANPDVSRWNISSLQTGVGMSSTFRDSGISRENYEKALIRFAEHDEDNNDLTLPENMDLREVPATFCSEAAAQAKIVLENNGWRGIGNRGTDCDSQP